MGFFSDSESLHGIQQIDGTELEAKGNYAHKRTDQGIRHIAEVDGVMYHIHAINDNYKKSSVT